MNDDAAPARIRAGGSLPPLRAGSPISYPISTPKLHRSLRGSFPTERANLAPPPPHSSPAAAAGSHGTLGSATAQGSQPLSLRFPLFCFLAQWSSCAVSACVQLAAHTRRRIATFCSLPCPPAPAPALRNSRISASRDASTGPTLQDAADLGGHLLAFLRLGALGDERLVDVGNASTARDGGLDQRAATRRRGS